MESKTVLEQIEDAWIKGEAQGIAEGETRGEARGEARGKAQGERQTKVSMILNLLKRRFGKVPTSVSAAINRMQDSVVLESYFYQALDSSSMEEFEQSLPGKQL